MTVLADTPGAPAIQGAFQYKHVPFTAFFKVEPIKGKRFETIRDLEALANSVESDLENLCGASDEISFDFTKPVAFTPQFGNNTARLTVAGHYCRTENWSKAWLGERLVINAGEYKTGHAASRRPTRNPSDRLDTIAADLKLQLETATGLQLTRLEVARYIYGQGGTHFA